MRPFPAARRGMGLGKAQEWVKGQVPCGFLGQRPKGFKCGTGQRNICLDVKVCYLGYSLRFVGRGYRETWSLYFKLLVSLKGKGVRGSYSPGRWAGEIGALGTCILSS